jgi:hypothetical protein
VWFRFEDSLNIDRPRYIEHFICEGGIFIILDFVHLEVVFFSKYRYFKMLKFISIAVGVTMHHVHIFWICIVYTKGNVHADVAWKIPVSRTVKCPSPLKRLGIFASSLNRYFSQITLANRIYLYKIYSKKSKVTNTYVHGLYLT